MKNNIKKFLICAFVSATYVVSLLGDIELSQPNKEVVAQTETENTLHSWESINNIAGASIVEKDETVENVVDIIINEEPIVLVPVPEPEPTPVPVPVPEPELEFKTGWVKTSVNVRKEPNTESEVLGIFNFNQQIEYADFNEEWFQIKYNDETAYIYKTYVSETINTYREFTVPKNRGFKSFEPYNNFNPRYRQYKLQQHAYTGEYGIRKVDERYCIALGTHFFENISNSIIGTYVDLVLENGEVIHCILGDIKANAHTNSDNIVTTANGCVSEFIVDKSELPSDVKKMGNMSYARTEWRSPVAKVIVYDKNFFDEQ